MQLRFHEKILKFQTQKLLEFFDRFSRFLTWLLTHSWDLFSNLFSPILQFIFSKFCLFLLLSKELYLLKKSHLLRNNERIFDFFPHCDWHTYWLVVGHELLMYFLWISQSTFETAENRQCAVATWPYVLQVILCQINAIF